MNRKTILILVLCVVIILPLSVLSVTTPRPTFPISYPNETPKAQATVLPLQLNDPLSIYVDMLSVGSKSDTFSEIGYSVESSTLIVRFERGAAYAYYDVPEEVWSSFCKADSLGTYYNEYIKGQFDCRRIYEKELQTASKTKVNVGTKINTSSTSSTSTYILNKNSKVFHMPTCASVKKMSDKNKIEFNGAREEVISKGYRPCQNCNS